MSNFKLLKSGVFMFLCFYMIFITNNIFLLKDGNWMKYKNYLNISPNTVDIIYMGSSHSNEGISPSIIDKVINIKSFNYSVTGMRIEQAVFRLQDMLKTQHPQLIVLDTFSFTPIADEHKEVLTRYAFDCLPLSKNKVEAINCVIEKDRESYYIPFLKYHTRWKEISERDINLLKNESLYAEVGFEAASSKETMEEKDSYFSEFVYNPNNIVPINDSQKQCFEGFLKIAKAKDIKVLLLTVPYKTQLGMSALQLTGINNYLEQNYVDHGTVKMLDMNRYYSELNFGYADLSNEGHVNKSGAQKVSKFLADYIQEEYELQNLVV